MALPLLKVKAKCLSRGGNGMSCKDITDRSVIRQALNLFRSWYLRNNITY